MCTAASAESDADDASPRVRRVAVGDLAIAAEIVAEYQATIGVVVRDGPPELRAYLDNGSGLWLASCGDAVVGCVALRPLPSRDAACEIKRLYVREAFRGRRVADALTDASEAYAGGCGYRDVYLDTKDDLLPALRFYARRGYVACERYNENPQATIFLTRRLPSFA